METKFESKTGKSEQSDETLYTFLSNFNNFRAFIPADKIGNFESAEDSCKFSVPVVGEMRLAIVDREPYKTLKVSGNGMGNQSFFLWIQLKQVAEKDTKIKLTMKADLNPMIKMMASKPIQEFLDKLVDAIEKISG